MQSNKFNLFFFNRGRVFFELGNNEMVSMLGQYLALNERGTLSSREDLCSFNSSNAVQTGCLNLRSGQSGSWEQFIIRCNGFSYRWPTLPKWSISGCKTCKFIYVRTKEEVGDEQRQGEGNSWAPCGSFAPLQWLPTALTKNYMEMNSGYVNIINTVGLEQCFSACMF